MRKITAILLLSLSFLYATEGFGQRGIGTNLPDRSSVLELKSETRGLLIPRFDLEALNNPSPVIAPANSLLVYNTKKDDAANLKPGYYYWVRDNQSDPTDPSQATPGKWIPLLNTAGNNIEIDENGVVSVKPGDLGEVLVTVEENGELISKWMPVSHILEDLLDIDGENGITVNYEIVETLDPVTGDVIESTPTFTVELGGVLNRTTEIITEGEKFEIRTGSVDIDGNPINDDGKEFFISNLNEIEVDNDGKIIGKTAPDDIFTEQFDVLIVDKNTGLVQRVSVGDLLKNAIEVESGLHYDDTDGKIKLGGELTKKTTITLDGNEFIIDTSADNTDPNSPQAAGEFKIKGLEETATANKIMVVDENNTVRTVRRVISKDITSSFTINTTDWSEYSSYVQEVNITVSGLLTVTADIDLTLPEANPVNEGQVINVSLTNETEPTTHTHALVIKDSTGADVTWGALPFQGWVLKSDGNQWRVVSSN